VQSSDCQQSVAIVRSLCDHMGELQHYSIMGAMMDTVKYHAWVQSETCILYNARSIRNLNQSIEAVESWILHSME
jgi:hypothetical protein